MGFRETVQTEAQLRVLIDEALLAVPAKAADHGRQNCFFHEDPEQLKAALPAELDERCYAHHPRTQHESAKTSIELDTIWAYLDRVATESRHQPEQDIP